MCRPVHISRFLCLCLDFPRLNWASAANRLQPRGQGYCLFLWLSQRATQTGRSVDINTAFVTLWMLLLLSRTISCSLLGDFSSFSCRCTFFTFLERWEVAGKRVAEPVCTKWPCRIVPFPLFLFLCKRRVCGHSQRHSELGERFPAATVGLHVFRGKEVLGALCIFFAKL